MEPEKKLEEKQKPPSKFKLILALLVLAAIIGGGYWVYGQAQKYLKHETVNTPVTPTAKPVFQEFTADAPTTTLEQPEVTPSLLPPLVSDNDQEAPPQTAPQPAPQNNRNFILYMAARDLRDSLNDPAQFQKELGFVRLASTEFPEIQGKIELLEIAAGEGIATKESLLQELDKLHLTLRNRNHGSFMANLQDSLGRLVTITKIEGDVEKADYNSIIKRAEIAINRGDYNQAAAMLSKLGEDGKPLLEKIHNLANAREIAEYIVDFAKSKIAGQ